MTTRKITTFLMCPAANGDALGGTPAASAASGGHIKKGAHWVHVHDAALLGLAAIWRERDHRAAQQSQDAASEDEVVDAVRVAVEHGTSANESAEGCGEAGVAHSGHRFQLVATFRLGPLEVATRHLAGNTGQLFELRGVLFGDVCVLLPGVHRLTRHMEFTC